MTLFFLILLAVCLTIFGFQRFRRRQKKPTIKPSLPEIEELVEKLAPEQPIKPAATASQIPQSAPEPMIVEPKEPMPQPVSQPIISELEKPIPSPEPGPRPALPAEQEPILLSPKEPEPPGNLPTG